MDLTTRPVDAPLRGIVLMCSAMLIMVGMSALTKQLSPTYSVTQLIWARFFFNLLLVYALFPGHARRMFVSKNVGWQLTRSAIIASANVLFVVALSTISIAEMVAITNIAPILITVLAALFLKERVSSVGRLAVAIAFVGVLIVLRPGSGVFQWAAVLPLGMAVGYAFNQIIARKIGHEEDPVTSLAYTTVVGVIVATLAVPFDWTTPDALGWVLLALTGLFGGISHFLIIRAYERSAAAVVAPFIYTELLWAILVGFLAFGDIPDFWTLVGSAVVAISGLYVLLREGKT